MTEPRYMENGIASKKLRGSMQWGFKPHLYDNASSDDASFNV